MKKVRWKFNSCEERSSLCFILSYLGIEFMSLIGYTSIRCRDEICVFRVREILMFSSCALPELGRASATNVNKLTDFQYASLFSDQMIGTVLSQL